MPKRDDALNRVIGDVLKGEAGKRGIDQIELARRAEISYSTLSKKLSGQTPILATELIRLASAIGATPERIVSDAQLIWSEMSAASDTDEVAKKRQQRMLAEKAADEIDEERRTTPNAAVEDDELDTDEPQAP